MLRRILNRQTLLTTTIAITAAVGSVAGVSLAQGNSGTSPTTTVATQPAPRLQPGGILAGVHEILASLVANGTIDQQQADAVQAQANAGSIDPKQLVQSGVLTDAQMRSIATQIDQLKRSYSP
jgi:hypothetical protein